MCFVLKFCFRRWIFWQQFRAVRRFACVSAHMVRFSISLSRAFGFRKYAIRSYSHTCSGAIVGLAGWLAGSSACYWIRNTKWTFCRRTCSKLFRCDNMWCDEVHTLDSVSRRFHVPAQCNIYRIYCEPGMQPDIRSFILFIISVSSSLTLNCGSVLVVVRMLVNTRIFGVCKLLNIIQAEKQHTWPQLRYLPTYSIRSRQMKSNVRYDVMMMWCAALPAFIIRASFAFSGIQIESETQWWVLFSPRGTNSMPKSEICFARSDLRMGCIFRRWCVLFAINLKTFVAIWMHVTLVSVSFCQTRYARELDFIEVSSSIKRRHATMQCAWISASHMRWLLFAVGHFICTRNFCRHYIGGKCPEMQLFYEFV